MLKSAAKKMQQQGMLAYVELMMGIVGRGLVAASEVDDVMQKEFGGFAAGTVIQMHVLPDGPGFTLEVGEKGQLRLLKSAPSQVHIGVRFKHLTHAFLVLSFQESTATAFAHDRMYVDGDVSQALRLVRCLNRMEILILPRLVAERAVKRYPDISLSNKLNRGGRIYGHLAKNFLRGE
ncbi:MAG: hypothetical protein HKM02_04070 [Pseudomonadales bacterium]|nr:hypothetical protein [Pseudomonadales bacterium]